MADSLLDFIHTGPGALAGEYLRRFWQPVYRGADLRAGQAVPVRIMNEQFTLYRGEGGAPHAVAFRCAHRGTQLSTGWVEGECIRCLYHGWRYDASGQCLEQPGEDESFAAKVHIRSYPTREYLGLIFVYLGQTEPPPFRHYLDFERPGVLEVNPPEHWACNYFNRIDNAPDPGHVAFTHREAVTRATPAAHPNIFVPASEETEYGTRTTTTLPNGQQTYLHFHMPNTNQLRSAIRFEGYVNQPSTIWVDLLFWRVPVDDDHCVSFVLNLINLTGADAEDYRQRRQTAQQLQPALLNRLAGDVLAGRTTMKGIDPRSTTYDLFTIEDYVTQVGQGAIPERSNEHLGRSDAGVILLRKIWQRELQALAKGKPLKEWSAAELLSEMTPPTAAPA